MATPTSRMTRGEIITQALQRAANTTKSLYADARVRLNRVLQDLYTQHDWPFLFVASPIVLARAGRFDLPVGFAKTQDEWGLRVTRDEAGNPCSYRVVQVDPMTFVSASIPPGQEAPYPRHWTIDHASSAGTYWPLPPASLLAELRYKLLPPDVPTVPIPAYDADVPIFPWPNYLQDVIMHWAMMHENDPRASQQFLENRDAFATIRGATFPPDTALARAIPLDQSLFTTPFRGDGGGPDPFR